MTVSTAQHRAEIEALDVELESFCYSVSHDLRAPVRAVIGFARVLEEDYAALLDAEGRRLLSVVIDEAARADTLIDGLLVLSRLSRQAMERVPVDMASMAREVAFEAAASVGLNQSAVLIAELPGVTGDHDMLRLAWSHLLSNAVKFSSLEPHPRLEIFASLEPSRIVYHVTDNGIGFDMQYAGQLFGMFGRLHGSDVFPGLGVGLAMVKRIVHRHGGTVWAAARPGGGATFSIGLPADNV
jgi:light-regulated signal transduction histidine kinase (bacteriophytochrome)